VENDEYAAFARRILRAYARRVADGDVEALTQHITMLHEDRTLLEKLRAACLDAAPKVTWTAAGLKLLEVYVETIKARSARMVSEMAQMA